MRPSILVLAVALESLSPCLAHADLPTASLRASMVCEAPSSPGRFRCDVEVRVLEGSLSWAEVEVIAVDDLVLPLRGRLGPRDAATRDADIYRWSLGFVAKGRGAATITARLRAVVCHGQACEPAQTDVSGRVTVGP